MDSKRSAKKAEQGKIPRHLYNQLVKLFVDRDFLKLSVDLRKELDNKPHKRPTKGFIIKSRNSIKNLLHNKDLPLSWLEPIYNFIMDDEIDFPLDSGITLRVGSQEITGRGTLLSVQDKDGRLVGEENAISIVITAKVSIEQILRFIRENRKEIEHWQKAINLPSHKRLNWRDINLALEIIRMKNEEGMTFAEISSKLSENENLTEKEQDYYSDENNIKTLYYRYQKRLSPET